MIAALTLTSPQTAAFACGVTEFNATTVAHPTATFVAPPRALQAA